MDNTQEMYALYQSGATLREVGASFGISATAVLNRFKRNNLVLKGRSVSRKKTSHVDNVDDVDLRVGKDIWDSLDSKIKGHLSESYVKNKLMELGFEVWQCQTPNHKSDLAVFCNDKLKKIQVKAATYVLGDKRFRASLTTKDKKGKHIKYTDGCFDFFIIFCPGVNAFYVVPYSECKNATSLNLLPQRERFKCTVNKYEQFYNAFELLCK